MSITCPKCGYERKPEDQAPDYECPRCGVIYEKARARPASTEQSVATRTKRTVKPLALSVLGWAFALFFMFTTVIAVSDGGGVWPILAGFVLVALCAPPARRWLYEKTKISVRHVPLVVICFILLVVQIHMSASGTYERLKREEAAEQKAKADQLAKTRAENLAYFEHNKGAVLRDITERVKTGQVNEALKLFNKYASVSNDPDLLIAKRAIESAQAKIELQDEANLPLAKKATLYRKLAQLDPHNHEYAAKAQRFGNEYDQQVAQAKAEQERQAAAALRIARIEAQFSKWDGSHINVQRAVKQSMHNPRSYQHVETRYLDTGSAISVTTTFRGTNSFGGVVLSTVIAEVDERGNVLSLRSAH